MRWKAIDPPLPKGNDTRFRREFAWKPIRVGDHKVWLEFFDIEERFFQPAGGSAGWWTEVKRHVLHYYA